jgi:SagB-type dehydrogenase family enzyme
LHSATTLNTEAHDWLTVLPTITVHDELITDYVLDTDVVVDGRRERTIETLTLTGRAPIGMDTRPVLVLGTRIYIDRKGAARFCAPLGEPQFERKAGCVVIRRRRREVVAAGDLRLLWEIFRAMDGSRSTAEVLDELLHLYGPAVMALLSGLVAADVVDTTGRPIARFIHANTKKGVLPGGALDLGDVLELVTDGNYRTYPQVERIRLQDSVPHSLRPFHALTVRRRSFRDYSGKAIGQRDFGALLKTACGVTGTSEWAGRQLKLRAYPSSGGLYSVEIYPVIFAVEGLWTGVYHYCPLEHALELIRPNIDRSTFIGAALPSEREMLAGVAVMVCLTGAFPRHEKKYGEGGYRMMIAEAGHIAQNLILTAIALGLDARPFGGVFDDLLNRILDINANIEQFLLSVIVGYADGKC